MTDLFQSAENEEISLLKSFLETEFPQVKAATRFATTNEWFDIKDPEQFEFFAPKGKLPFIEYTPWLTGNNLFFAAIWANFMIPGELVPIGTMTMHEAWVDDFDVKYLFEMCCELYDAEPVHTEKAIGQMVYLWGKDINAHGDMDSLKMNHFDDGGHRFTVTNTRLVKAT